MLRIALTGPSGSGKGYVAALLAKRGVSCLDTDAVVHVLYEDRAFAAELSKKLGADIRGADGRIDRKKLGALVYSNEEKMKALQSAVYPSVREKCAAFFDARAAAGDRAAAIDAPQLFEAGMEGDFDLILAVDAPKAVRLARVRARDGITRKEALLRFSKQKSGKEYRARAHHTLINDGKRDPEVQLDGIPALARLREP